MSSKPRRQFTPEQKAEAVRIVTQSGKPISQIAKEMGLTESALRNWVKQAQIDQAAAPNGALTTEERQELNRLRREVKRLQMEREFLKKAAAFFAAENIFWGKIRVGHRTDELCCSVVQPGQFAL